MVTADGIELRAIPLPNVLGYYASRCGWIWSTWRRRVNGRRGAWIIEPDAKPPVRLACPINRRRTSPRGYRHITLCVGGKVVHQGNVHRLILLTFKGPPPTPDHEAAHENGDSLDNRVENLNWKTSKENQHDRYRHGTIGHLRGEQVNHKLTEADVLDIRQRYAGGGLTQKELAAEYELHQVTVSEIVTRKIWTHI